MIYPDQIRADTAEHLYLVLQSKDLGYDTDEVENILLETEWSVLSSCHGSTVLSAGLQVIKQYAFHS